MPTIRQAKSWIYTTEQLDYEKGHSIIQYINVKNFHNVAIFDRSGN